jgi:hypothetical protein
MSASDHGLHIFCEAEDQPALDRVQEILDSHLTRFGKREGVQLVWR